MSLPGPILTTDIPDGFVNAALFFLKAWTKINQIITYLTTATGDAGWVTPSMSNGWVAFGGSDQIPQYRLKSGVVWLGGIAKSGTVSTAMFTLPVGMRPLGNLIFTAANNGVLGIMTISSTGVVIGPANNTYVSLNGIQFIAEQ